MAHAEATMIVEKNLAREFSEKAVRVPQMQYVGKIIDVMLRRNIKIHRSSCTESGGSAPSSIS